ncbi:MAG: hypothetical protein J6Q76_00255 [Clostridia bacterium]|nr:hypothetical protein [Clostridia bacterium]
MKKRLVWLIVATAFLLTVTVGVTFAMLIASSQPVVNTFTVGNVNITLDETTGTEYKLSPGVELMKNPTVTVKANSENCWLFVKVEKSTDFDKYCSYSISSDWANVEGYDGIYCQKVTKSAIDRKYGILKNNRVTVNDTLTEEQLAAISKYPTLKFTAYAIQSDSFSNPADAWQNFEQ